MFSESLIAVPLFSALSVTAFSVIIPFVPRALWFALAVFGWDAIYAALSPSNPIPTVIHAASVAALSGALAALLFGNASFWVTLFTVGAAEFAFVFGLEPLWGGKALPKQETQRVLSPINVRNISLY